MFISNHIPMLIAKATLKLDKDADGKLCRVADLSLVIDPFPYELASELELNIARHLFNAEKQIRPELQDITLNPRAGKQRITVASAPDAPILATIRHASIIDLSVVRMEKAERQWLKATVLVRIDLAERAIREFLFFHFGEYRLFSFLPEQLTLSDAALEGIRPSGPDESVTLSAGGKSVTLHSDGRTDRSGVKH